MARSVIARCSLLSAGLIAASLVVAPARAQFGSIFRDEPPRPPADVPIGPNNFPRPIQPQGYPPNTPQPYPQAYPQGYPRAYPQSPQAPERYPVDTQRQQPGARGNGVEAQPLPPPPGGSAAPPNPGAVPQQQPGTAVRTLPGLPPGQRQPTGTPQPQQAESGAPTKEVVVAPPPNPIDNPTAVFAGLDKITGRIISFDVAINETVQFGALQVTPKACYTRAPTEQPRTDAFVDVDEVTLKGEVKRIFTGWMFASSPGLHAVEHPIYDVWLTDCKGGKPTVAEGDDKGAQASAQATPTPRRATRRR